MLVSSPPGGLRLDVDRHIVYYQIGTKRTLQSRVGRPELRGVRVL